ncbi:MobA/MobL family protein, partial [Salmonella enterica subsp. enterica serovar Kentucky]|uniref:MobA/MobL family protein n=1 Tax=Salmonella enterica TaxID=28901 RepID=UPI003F4B29D8
PPPPPPPPPPPHAPPHAATRVLTHDYTRNRGVDISVILTPVNAPSWCGDRSVLWNSVEKAEQRRESKLAMESELSIPREISREAARETVLAFVRENLDR